MLQHFGCCMSTVDAFALAATHQFTPYWIAMDSARQRSWPKESIWANAPFQWLEQVAKKFISDKVQGILLLPDY